VSKLGFLTEPPKFLVSLITAYIQGKVNPKVQDENQASYTSLLKKEDGFIPSRYFSAALNGRKIDEKWPISFMKGFNQTPDPSSLERFVRAMNPWPIAWTLVKAGGKEQKAPLRLKILKCHPEEEKLKPEIVQLEGKNRLIGHNSRKPTRIWNFKTKSSKSEKYFCNHQPPYIF